MAEEFVSTNLEEQVAGPVAIAMQGLLTEAFQPVAIHFDNESQNHSGPATDSHFKLLLVSGAFEGLSLVKRHQAVYRCVREFLSGGVHALSLHLFTPAEWQEKAGFVADSPACRGGSKAG